MSYEIIDIAELASEYMADIDENPTERIDKIESRLAEDGYKALIVSVPEGYVKPEPTEYFYFEAGEYSLTVILELA